MGGEEGKKFASGQGSDQLLRCESFRSPAALSARASHNQPRAARQPLGTVCACHPVCSLASGAKEFAMPIKPEVPVLLQSRKLGGRITGVTLVGQIQ